MKIFLLVALLILTGCELRQDPGRIRYIRDPRTEICFAHDREAPGSGSGFTYVPCTEQVLKAIEEDERLDRETFP